MTTEAQYVLSPGTTPHNTARPPQTAHPPQTDQVHTDATDRPTPAALELSTHEANHTQTSTAPNEKTSTPQDESKKASQSTWNETTGPTTGPSSMVSDGSERPKSGAQNGGITNTTVSDTETTAPSSVVLRTTSTLNSSVQTSNGNTPTQSVTDGPLQLTTRAVPTAKLSATTETVIAQTSDSVAQTSDSVAQTSTTELASTVQRTTTKPAVLPPVVTKKDTTTSSDNKDQGKSFKHGKIVAGIIGAALLAMMIGFLLILYKQHKLREHQFATTDWAGPTPFLETRSESNGQVTLRSENRISLASFLPQRMSKRLSLLAESRDEMQDAHELTSPTTFAKKEERKEERKVERNGTQTAKSEISAREAAVDKTTTAENVTVVNEMKGNGEVQNKEDQSGQAKEAKGENGAAENPQTQSNDGGTGKSGTDRVV
ncbi:uncharacterized protein [Eucyclogobius newberryi]|uniref:uncharacterized protein n=1 Tax=Eucyclogobius newberryi TaxID=166745 RepID=UPI003B5C73DD